MSATAYTGWLMEARARQAMLPALPQIVASAFAHEEGAADEGLRRAEGGEGALEDVHAVLANLMLALIMLHVSGVVLASVRHRENLARAMITGNKRAPEPGDIA